MEIEAKFTISDRETYIQLRNLDSLYGLQLTEASTQDLRDTYLDTEKKDLYAQGYALRQREASEQAWITLKNLDNTEKGSIHKREELETAVASQTPLQDWPPGPVLDKVQSLIGPAALVPLLTLHQTRVTRRLVDGSREIGELCLDEVSIIGTNKSETFIELELELQPGGTAEELEKIATALGNDWNLKPQKKSKYSRAMALINRKNQNPKTTRKKYPKVTKKPKKNPGITREDSMASAARKTLTLHFRRMLFHEPGTRIGEDIEELHDMRVATRRLRAALPVFSKFIDPAKLKPLRKGLKITGRYLGAVRDLDVFWEKTTEYLESQLPGDAADLTSLRGVWENERKQARKKMLGYLDSKTYRNFVLNFHTFLEDNDAWTPPALQEKGEPVPHHLKLVVPVAVYQRLAEVLAYDEWVSQPEVPLEQYHQLRIAAKRLRYTMEYFREALGPEVDMLIERIKALQDHLGDLQDCVIAREILTDFLKWGAWKPKKKDKRDAEPHQPMLFQHMGVKAYLKAREHEQQILIDSFPHIWGEITDPYFSHSIAAMVTAW